jgi:hypothetical protein
MGIIDGRFTNFRLERAFRENPNGHCGGPFSYGANRKGGYK